MEAGICNISHSLSVSVFQICDNKKDTFAGGGWSTNAAIQTIKKHLVTFLWLVSARLIPSQAKNNQSFGRNCVKSHTLKNLPEMHKAWKGLVYDFSRANDHKCDGDEEWSAHVWHHQMENDETLIFSSCHHGMPWWLMFIFSPQDLLERLVVSVCPYLGKNIIKSLLHITNV